MKRLHVACVLILLGVTAFGVAFGLVYIDARVHRTGLVPGPEDLPMSGETPSTLITAVCMGPLGAGAALVGMLLGTAELLRIWKSGQPQP